MDLIHLSVQNSQITIKALNKNTHLYFSFTLIHTRRYTCTFFALLIITFCRSLILMLNEMSSYIPMCVVSIFPFPLSRSNKSFMLFCTLVKTNPDGVFFGLAVTSQIVLEGTKMAKYIQRLVGFGIVVIRKH